MVHWRETARWAGLRWPPSRTAFIVFLVIGQTAWDLITAFTTLNRFGWVNATVVCVVVVAALTGFATAQRDGLLARLLIFGVTAGIVELASDYWLVAVTGTLVYAQPEPLIWVSPVYMPLAWAAILVQIGYFGFVVAAKWGLGPATIFAAALGGSLIPFYESIAYNANLWTYRDTPMIWRAPYYVILGEALVALVLPALIRYAQHKPLRTSIGLGLVQGLWIFAAYWLAYRLVACTD